MGNGTVQWLLQRFSALILLAYTIYLVYFYVAYPDPGYARLVSLFDTLAERLFATLTLLALVVHSWIGLWSVCTDYLTERALGRRGTALRLLVEMIILLMLFAYLGVGLSAVWSGRA